MNDPDRADSPCHRAPFTIPADHPSLAGHFPGHPTVAGVLLLDRVLDAAAAWQAREPWHADLPLLPQVKFSGPMQPGRPAEVILERTAGKLKFRIEQDGQVLARGVFASG